MPRTYPREKSRSTLRFFLVDHTFTITCNHNFNVCLLHLTVQILINDLQKKAVCLVHTPFPSEENIFSTCFVTQKKRQTRKKERSTWNNVAKSIKGEKSVTIWIVAGILMDFHSENIIIYSVHNCTARWKKKHKLLQNNWYWRILKFE